MLCYRTEATLPKARKLRPTKPLPRTNTTNLSCTQSATDKQAVSHTSVKIYLAYVLLTRPNYTAVIFHPCSSSSRPCLAFPNYCSIHTRLQSLSILTPVFSYLVFLRGGRPDVIESCRVLLVLVPTNSSIIHNLAIFSKNFQLSYDPCDLSTLCIQTTEDLI